MRSPDYVDDQELPGAGDLQTPTPAG